MADNKKEQKPRNENAEMANFEQRVKTVTPYPLLGLRSCIVQELEAPHRWNKAWGEFFRTPASLPQEYPDRIDHLEKEITK